MLKEKENLGIKLVHGEEEKKKLTKENELLAKKIAENGRVCVITLLSYIRVILFMLKSLDLHEWACGNWQLTKSPWFEPEGPVGALKVAKPLCSLLHIILSETCLRETSFLLKGLVENGSNDNLALESKFL